ncbi:MAG: GNAT family protein [Synechococcales bacterium]|nr:GNAT family protein [Synechococcales bacterium]
MLTTRLRPSHLDDLDFVLAAENAPENSPFVSQWPRDRHIAALGDPDDAHLILERQADLKPVGYLIFQGLTEPNLSRQLRRLVVTEKGKGYGRAGVRLAKQLAFETWGIHRLWLDVKTFNTRAQALYRSEGFVVEGTMRDCLKVGDRFESLVLMSILRPEYEQLGTTL